MAMLDGTHQHKLYKGTVYIQIE